MRLISTETLELCEFFDSGIPPYAILSHKWEEDEVSYQDMLKGKKMNGAGYAKILKCCAIALRDDHEWVWIDTCCIDKKSSAELSEAINSMFRWYKNSMRCYAYLSDIEGAQGEDGEIDWPTFKNSKWFMRGWKLQELIAPTDMVFFDCHWEWIGRREALIEKITEATGIPSNAFDYPELFSVAQKMSWASKRETSRVEDMAYCLMGLFNINMPLLYGEGIAAFQRLQHEIIRISCDESFFVWGGVLDLRDELSRTNRLLAPTPASFAGSGEVIMATILWRKPYSMTNIGLKISTPLYIDPQRRHDSHYLIPLNCRLDSKTDYPQLASHQGKIAMMLQELGSRDDDSVNKPFLRRGWRDMPKDAKEVGSTKTIYIRLDFNGVLQGDILRGY